MHRASQTYKAVSKTIANPRDVEANLLLHAAARMKAIQDGWDSKQPELDSVLHYNRKLWTIFMTSVTGPDNPLPPNIKQNIANLGLFVIKHTLSILADPQREQLGSLININRELASGLRSQTQ